ncbi:MAG TPA: histone deacetylase [Candidatus Latescibacteria bacterium]|nr:histone deacetylase [Candidatus Latescibacterota bacterium]
MLKTGLVYDPIYLLHNPGRDHPERPERLAFMVKHLETTGLLARLQPVPPYQASIDWVVRVHHPGYIEHVAEVCRRGHGYLNSLDTGVCCDSYHIALMAVGGVLSAIDAVMAGEVKNAFCAVRPPGHHAEADRAMGFCLFNNVAIAARYLQVNYQIERILIVDWDVHHGNGTQATFYDDPTVLYFSVHQYPHYPGSGSEREKGIDDGTGYTINVPMAAGCGDEDYVKTLQDQLEPSARKFKPNFVLISAGFDAHKDDPLSNMFVSEKGFAQMTAFVKGIAEGYCDGRLVSVLEGGYNLPALANSVHVHISALCGTG